MAHLRWGRRVICIPCNWYRQFKTEIIAAEVCDIHNLIRHGEGPRDDL